MLAFRPSPQFTRRGIAAALAAVIAFNAVSCGTIMYPERRGLPGGRIDPTVVIMDGILLLFFFVPGVIAFAVDFATGAIYLPPYGYSHAPPEQFSREKWVRVDVDPQQLDRAEIERVVSAHAGVPVQLEPGTFEARETYQPELVQVRAARPAPPALLDTE